MKVTTLDSDLVGAKPPAGPQAWEYVSESSVFEPVLFKHKTVVHRFFLSCLSRPKNLTMLQSVVCLMMDSQRWAARDTGSGVDDVPLSLLQSSVYGCTVFLDEPERSDLLRLPTPLYMRPGARMSLRVIGGLAYPELFASWKLHLVGVHVGA